MAVAGRRIQNQQDEEKCACHYTEATKALVEKSHAQRMGKQLHNVTEQDVQVSNVQVLQHSMFFTKRY